MVSAALVSRARRASAGRRAGGGVAPPEAGAEGSAGQAAAQCSRPLTGGVLPDGAVVHRQHVIHELHHAHRHVADLRGQRGRAYGDRGTGAGATECEGMVGWGVHAAKAGARQVQGAGKDGRSAAGWWGGLLSRVCQFNESQSGSGLDVLFCLQSPAPLAVVVCARAACMHAARRMHLAAQVVQLTPNQPTNQPASQLNQ